MGVRAVANQIVDIKFGERRAFAEVLGFLRKPHVLQLRQSLCSKAWLDDFLDEKGAVEERLVFRVQRLAQGIERTQAIRHEGGR